MTVDYGFTLVVRVSVCLSIFSFPDDNLSNIQWIFVNLGVCINIIESSSVIGKVFLSCLPLNYNKDIRIYVRLRGSFPGAGYYAILALILYFKRIALFGD